MADQRCPICDAEVTPSLRYPSYVCVACVRLASAADGRRVEFWDYPDFGGRYIESREPYMSEECFVRGVRCYAAIAYMGGTVIRPAPQGPHATNSA
jgi:hypothetical protein